MKVYTKARQAGLSTAARNIELGKIHIGKKQLQLDDDVYRSMLWQVAQVKSASDLDPAGRQKVLQHMVLMGATFTKSKTKRTTPAIDKARLASKVKALLTDGKYPDTYGDSMAQKMFSVQRWEWLTPDQMHKLVAALVINQQRIAKREEQ